MWWLLYLIFAFTLLVFSIILFASAMVMPKRYISWVTWLIGTFFFVVAFVGFNLIHPLLFLITATIMIVSFAVLVIVQLWQCCSQRRNKCHKCKTCHSSSASCPSSSSSSSSSSSKRHHHSHSSSKKNVSTMSNDSDTEGDDTLQSDTEDDDDSNNYPSSKHAKSHDASYDDTYDDSNTQESIASDSGHYIGGSDDDDTDDDSANNTTTATSIGSSDTSFSSSTASSFNASGSISPVYSKKQHLRQRKQQQRHRRQQQHDDSSAATNDDDNDDSYGTSTGADMSGIGGNASDSDSSIGGSVDGSSNFDGNVITKNHALKAPMSQVGNGMTHKKTARLATQFTKQCQQQLRTSTCMDKTGRAMCILEHQDPVTKEWKILMQFANTAAASTTTPSAPISHSSTTKSSDDAKYRHMYN